MVVPPRKPRPFTEQFPQVQSVYNAITSRRLFFAGKHCLLATLQFACLLYTAISTRTFNSSLGSSQFFGHLGPGGFLVWMGCLELSTLENSSKAMSNDDIQLLEGKAAMVGSMTYIVANTFHIWDSTRGFDLHFGSREQEVYCVILLSNCYKNTIIIEIFVPYPLLLPCPTGWSKHITIMLVIFVCGALAIRLAKGPYAKEQLPMVIFSVSFGFFVAQHGQPNMIGLLRSVSFFVYMLIVGVLFLLALIYFNVQSGYYMHYGCCAFVLLHAVARVSGYRLSAAGFILIAGYLFFYGQSGIVMYLNDQNTNPTAVLLGSTAFAMIWLVVYTLFFPQNLQVMPPSPLLPAARTTQGDDEAAGLMSYIKMGNGPAVVDSLSESNC